VEVIKGQGGFQSSQSAERYNLNVTMQLDEEMNRFLEQGDNVKWMGKCGTHNCLYRQT